jgi:hypothetical protein
VSRRENSRLGQEFCRGYITAALWSSTDDGGEPLDRNFSQKDIAPTSLRKMKHDCVKFMEANRRDLVLYCETVRYNPSEGSEMAYAGHDFWLTRNGHGAGFWDRDGISEQLGERLTKASKKFGSSDLYVGDDGKVHVS